MAIGSSAVCNSFKQEVLVGTHNFTASSGDTFNLALYTNSATIDATTTAYSVGLGGQVTGTGYTAGGKPLTSVTPTLPGSGTVAVCDFDPSVSWAGATITSRGCLIYNTSKSDKAVCVLNFGGDKTATAGTFTIQFPAATAADAIIQLA
tara:strand:+ start:3927 stop:4373 length:447 start_codon:yes stop_codon:yes gene_type:complete